MGSLNAASMFMCEDSTVFEAIYNESYAQVGSIVKQASLIYNNLLTQKSPEVVDQSQKPNE